MRLKHGSALHMKRALQTLNALQSCCSSTLPTAALYLLSLTPQTHTDTFSSLGSVLTEFLGFAAGAFAASGAPEEFLHGSN